MAIGTHIRKRRLDLKLFQKDVAALFGVSEDIVAYWEKGRSKPSTRYLPVIIDFLGYTPFSIEAQNFGERIRLCRLTSGLTNAQMGKIMEVHGSTIISWESGEDRKSVV